MTELQERLNAIRQSLPAQTRLVAVSKYHPAEALQEAYDAGQRIFGENIVQELQQKQQILPKDIQWHYIGHLQTNKVKYIAPYVALIHAVDSLKLLQEIDKQAKKVNRIIPCLLQLHVAKEETKFGFTIEECREFLKAGEWKTLKNVRIDGLMCMASNVDDQTQVHEEFRSAYDFFKEAKETFFADSPDFKERSWGMSHDYPIAIEEGSTLVRVGTKIFGERAY